MAFDWIGACRVLVDIGLPVTAIGALYMFAEDERKMLTVFAVLFVALMFVSGGLPPEVV